MSTLNRIGILGLGLIGGSMAHLIRKYIPNAEIYAQDIANEHLDLAKRNGVIVAGFSHIEQMPKSLDLIIICTPLDQIIPSIKIATSHFDQVILMDCGSVKSAISQKMPSLKSDQIYIGAHPMAGSTQQGFRHASANCLEGARFFLMENPDPRRQILKLFIERLGFEIISCDPNTHDHLTGFASHVPYLMASISTQIARRHIAENQIHAFQKTISSGFRDSTRVAESDPSWGRDICLMNRSVIRTALNTAKDEINYLLDQMDQNPVALQEWLQSVADFRQEITSVRVKNSDSDLLDEMLPI